MRVKKWPKPVQYDLDQPHIENQHLYYNHKTDKQILQKETRQRRVSKRDEMDLTNTSIEAIIEDLNDEALFHRASMKIFFRINQLETIHADVKEEYKDFVKYRLLKLTEHCLPYISLKKTNYLITYLNKYQAVLSNEHFEN